jgi:cell division protein FtsA
MNQNKLTAGVIDIGTTKVVAIVGEYENDYSFNILGCGVVPSKGVKRGNVVNIINTVESIQAALSLAQNQAGIKVNEVYVGIAGQNIYSRKSSFTANREFPHKEITKEEIDEIIKKQYFIPTDFGEKIIEVIPKSISIDDNKIYNLEEIIGCIGKELKMEFNIVIGKVTNIKSIETCIDRAELKLKKIFLEPIASARAVLYNEEFQKGTILIDIGGGTSDIAVYHKGMLQHTNIIPLGGNTITQDIEKNFNLTFNEAEQLKIKFGQAIYEESQDKQIIIKNKIEGKEPITIDTKILSNVIKARVEEILGFIEHDISLHITSNDRKNFDIVVTGGGALLKNLVPLIKFKLGMDTRIGYPNIYLKNTNAYNSPQFATAIGLLIMAFDDIKQNNNNLLNKNNQMINETNITTEANKATENTETLKENDSEDNKKTKPIKKGIKTIQEFLSNLFNNNDTEI